MLYEQTKRPKRPSQHVEHIIYLMLLHGNVVVKGMVDRAAARNGYRSWSTSAFEPQDGKQLVQPRPLPMGNDAKGVRHNQCPVSTALKSGRVHEGRGQIYLSYVCRHNAASSIWSLCTLSYRAINRELMDGSRIAHQQGSQCPSCVWCLVQVDGASNMIMDGRSQAQRSLKGYRFHGSPMQHPAAVASP